jgi:hypothetical protein
MRVDPRKALLLALLSLLALPAGAMSRVELGAIEIYDRTAGQVLPVHEHQGRYYVAGEPGHEYELVLRNHTGGRLLAVTSVDGVNVVSGQTAAPEQTGYVLPAHGSTAVAGWRKSLDEVAAFYFTKHKNSYAARTGRPFDVGVIGVALFREKAYCCDYGWRERDAMGDHSAGAAAPEAAPPELQSRRQESAQDHAERPAAGEPRLGTGHGRREPSGARHTDFERAGDAPDQIIAIYYDTRANLVAQGVIPRPRHYAQRRPRAFPGSFVPDP